MDSAYLPRFSTYIHSSNLLTLYSHSFYTAHKVACTNSNLRRKLLTVKLRGARRVLEKFVYNLPTNDLFAFKSWTIRRWVILVPFKRDLRSLNVWIQQRNRTVFFHDFLKQIMKLRRICCHCSEINFFTEMFTRVGYFYAVCTYAVGSKVIS